MRAVLVIFVGLVAGCAGSTVDSVTDVKTAVLESGEGEAYSYSLPGSADFAWTLSAPDSAPLSVYVMDAGELANFQGEGEFEFYGELSRENFNSGSRSGELPAGDYVVGVMCGGGVLDSCEYELSVVLTPK